MKKNNWEVDVRGLSCPEPVIRTKKALESIKEGEIKVLTDSAISRENIIRFAQNAGCEVNWREEKGVFEIAVRKTSEVKEEEKRYQEAIFITSDTIGSGDEQLGKLLMRLFLHTLTELSRKADYLLFMNNGVKLTIEGSEVLETLKRLESAGVEIMVCGTCLDFYEIKEKVRVGKVSNMYELAERLLACEKVLKI